MDGLKLEIEEFHLSRKKAENHVFEIADKLSIDVPERNSLNQDVYIRAEAKPYRLNFGEEIEHTRREGKANKLQVWFDAQDTFLHPAIEMASFSTIPGLSIEMSATVGSFHTSTKDLGVLQSPDVSLANDIAFFHRETCSAFNSRDTSAFSRSFRAFLHSCVSLVDCFLYRYALYVKEKVDKAHDYSNIAILDSQKRVEERLESWMMTFATHKYDDFKTWNERSGFLDLKKKRNGFTHPTEPVVKYELRDVAKYLNLAASGVGKLLGRMRRASGFSDRIGYINQIATLPRVRIGQGV